LPGFKKKRKEGKDWKIRRHEGRKSLHAAKVVGKTQKKRRQKKGKRKRKIKFKKKRGESGEGEKGKGRDPSAKVSQTTTYYLQIERFSDKSEKYLKKGLFHQHLRRIEKGPKKGKKRLRHRIREGLREGKKKPERQRGRHNRGSSFTWWQTKGRREGTTRPSGGKGI